MQATFKTINQLATDFQSKVKTDKESKTQNLIVFVNIKELKKDRFNKMFAPLISIQYVNSKNEKVFMTYSELEQLYGTQTIYLSGLELNDRFKKFEGLAVKIDISKSKMINDHLCFKYEFCKFNPEDEKFAKALVEYENSYEVETIELY